VSVTFLIFAYSIFGVIRYHMTSVVEIAFLKLCLLFLHLETSVKVHREACVCRCSSSQRMLKGKATPDPDGSPFASSWQLK